MALKLNSNAPVIVQRKNESTVAYNKRRRDIYRLLGLCKCGRNLDRDGALCSVCLQAARRKRKKQKQEGRCPICGKPTEGGGYITCRECRERGKERYRK